MQPDAVENKQAAAIKAKADAAGTFGSTLLSFLSPEVCANSASRALYPNSGARAACPVYQRGIIETGTVDIGNHQNRAIIVVPHVACPVLLSHSALSGVACNLFYATTSAGGRLKDICPGRYGGSGLQPLYTCHEIPQHLDFSPGGSIALPIHGGFYTENAIASGSANRQAASVMYRDWTTVSNLGVLTAIRAIPASLNDSVRFTALVRSAVWVSTDLQCDVVTTDAAGTLTTTSANIVGTGAVSGNVITSSVTLPACVGIVSVSIRCVVARAVDMISLSVLHSCNTSAVPAGTELGSFVGSPISGYASLKPITTAARVTGLSLKASNVASALNANGYLVGVATQGSLPGNAGVFGEASITGLVSAKSFKFVDGSYMALAPPLDLKFDNMDSLPSYDLNYGMYIITSQDNTPITMKLEYHAVVEIVTQDPLFAPLPARFDPGFLSAIKTAQESGGYLVLSENPFHWGAIGDVFKKAKEAFTSPMVKGLVSAADKLGIPFAHSAKMAEDYLSSSPKKPALKRQTNAHPLAARAAAKRPRNSPKQTQRKQQRNGQHPPKAAIRRIEQMLEKL